LKTPKKDYRKRLDLLKGDKMNEEKRENMLLIFSGVFVCIAIFLVYLIIWEFFEPSLISMMMIGFSGILGNIILVFVMNRTIFPRECSRKM